MALNLRDPSGSVPEPELSARITVFGVGGAGGNAVNNMIEKALPGVEFIAANTDSQALTNSRAPRKLQMGTGVTRGLGAGSKPDVGYTAAEETVEDIASALEGAHMCFITAGMGGGTGTGAAPVVARVARELGILTVGVVTKPFHFEGNRRMAIADAGVAEMQKVVDTLIVIPNQNLFQVASERTTFVEAFIMADDVLYQGVQGVTDLMVRPGMINLDFADVKSVMEEMGKAMMGTGESEGETRAIDAAEKAIANPLLDEVSLKGARGVLINITGGYDLTLFEMDEAANRIKDEVDADALIKFGSALDPDMNGRMRVSVVATGIEAEAVAEGLRESEAAAPPAPRRKPAETDPGLVSVLRGGQAPRAGAGPRPAAPAVPAAPEQPEPAASGTARRRPATGFSESPRPEMFQPGGTARGRFPLPSRKPAPRPEDLAAAAGPDAEASPEPAAPAPDPQPEPAADRVEAAAAASPAPEDIRKRAEEVRRRAADARDGRSSRSESRESGLFEMDDAAIDTSSFAPAPSAPTGEPEPRRAAGPDLAAPRRDQPEPAPRNGRFKINSLISRVAGGGAGQAPRADAPAAGAAGEDEDGELPAFLRRQAN